ncbi:hypothetical protein BURKHO8Y_240380 [Burkholderia sp. 8Y]|nr:hypothetical protein BURKHO8Y_240380 [Burkholderia sp. 8Y]
MTDVARAFYPARARAAGRRKPREASSEKFPNCLNVEPKVFFERRRKPKQAAKQLAAPTKNGVV